ncbi:sensor histidine kinase [Janibacter sp. G1551]|uniref:sensor histidine kinase n=1 Tax=Janibacter sp. G1551 TaxID=3420440 RepID=UPI003D043D1E
MRQALIRSTTMAVLAAAAVMGVPLLALLVWVAARDRAQVEHYLSAERIGELVVRATFGVAALTVIAVVVGTLIARRQAKVLADPLRRLAERAERLGAGESRFEPLDSGIAEVDLVADVLAHSAAEFNRTIADERRFAADASHQLRTPLTALLMRLEEIAMTDDLEAIREEANIGMTQVERLTQVVDDMLSRSRQGAGADSSVSLDSVLASLQREFQPSFGQARRSIHVKGTRGLVVRCTPTNLSQILATLLENSLIHGAGTVEVDARRSGPSVVIEVRDQGQGVPLALAPHIFERSVTSGGSGLGLSLARDIAEKSGGRLELLSAQPAVFAAFLSEAGAVR